VGKLLASYAAKIDSDPEPTVLVQPYIIYKPEPKVVISQNQKLLMSQSQKLLSWCHCKKRYSHGPQKLKSFLLILL